MDRGGERDNSHLSRDGVEGERVASPVGTPRSHFIRVQGVDLHCLEWGMPTAPPLLLLHGGAAHAHWWDHIAPAFAQDHRVFALDLRGHGESGWVVPPAYEVEDYVADVGEVIRALHLPRPVLIGHSLGGFVAMAYALAAPETVGGLVVIDIGPRLGGSRFMRLLRTVPPPVYRDEAELISRFRLLPVDTSAPLPLLHHIARQSVRRQVDGSLRLKCDRAALVRGVRDLRAQLTQISCPTLFVRGEQSRHVSAALLRTMVTLCPRAQGVEIAGAGHHVFLDQPHAFLRAVQTFLRKVRGQTNATEVAE
ncbi:MAG: alpha/beta hydrolase [Candidatus Binatia bacterium]|nr:alpha/beta hydrolase [Candidatus Binatia bacterium]